MSILSRLTYIKTIVEALLHNRYHGWWTKLELCLEFWENGKTCWRKWIRQRHFHHRHSKPITASLTSLTRSAQFLFPFGSWRCGIWLKHGCAARFGAHLVGASQSLDTGPHCRLRTTLSYPFLYAVIHSMCEHSSSRSLSTLSSTRMQHYCLSQVT